MSSRRWIWVTLGALALIGVPLERSAFAQSTNNAGSSSNSKKKVPPLDFEVPDTVVKTPKNGDTISLTIPTGGELYVTTRPGLRFSMVKAKIGPTLESSGSQNNLTFRQLTPPGGSAASQLVLAAFDLVLADGRKVSFSVRSQKSTKTATYVIID